MKKLIVAVCASLTMAGAAFAGLNPATPGLPIFNAPEFSAQMSNNRLSSMCVACHTTAPRPGGSHFVSTTMVGNTSSGGSGISNTGATAVRDNGAYFKISYWNANGTAGAQVYSKYGQLSNSVAPLNNVAGTKTAVQVAVTGNNYAAFDIICESCHNIIINEAGGNNLVCTQPNNNWQDAANSDICIGCHGTMYTLNAANAGDPLYNGTVSQNEVTTGSIKDNNEWHSVRGVAYRQNHHVLTNSAISSAKAAARLLWTDNDVVANSVIGIANNQATRGTYPQRTAWATGFNKPANGAFINCTHCHAPAHGGDLANGTGPDSSAASILRLTTGVTNANIYTVARTGGAIARISDGASAYKKIDDRYYCSQCHQ